MPRATRLASLLAGSIGLAVGLATPPAFAGSSDLTPCRGDWRGTGTDPWNPKDPYAIELHISGGTEQCATVKYVDLCTTRWVDCKVSGEWVTATEVLVDPGPCIPTHVTLQCVDPDTVALKFEADLGIMETTLHRMKVEPAAAPTVRPAVAEKPPVPVETLEPRRDAGCGCSFAGMMVLPLAWRRRNGGNS